MRKVVALSQQAPRERHDMLAQDQDERPTPAHLCAEYERPEKATAVQAHVNRFNIRN